MKDPLEDIDYRLALCVALKCNHYMTDKMRERGQAIIDRYNAQRSAVREDGMSKWDKAPRGAGSAGLRKGAPYDDIPDPPTPPAASAAIPPDDEATDFAVARSYAQGILDADAWPKNMNEENLCEAYIKLLDLWRALSRPAAPVKAALEEQGLLEAVAHYIDLNYDWYNARKFLACPALHAAISALIAQAVAEKDDPETDCTDFAHPAWWRGNDRGVEAAASRVQEALDGETKFCMPSTTLTNVCQKVAEMRKAVAEKDREIERLKVRILNCSGPCLYRPAGHFDTTDRCAMTTPPPAPAENR